MRLGVDFGTTRTVVAAVDRGNYPIVSFTDTHGDAVDHFPSVVARTDAGLVYGFEAVAQAASGAPALRSMKRHLDGSALGPDSTITIGGTAVGLVDVVAGYLTALQHALRTASTVAEDLAPGPIPAAVAVPAHAHGAQRFWTIEAFARAGFEVTRLVNEPSAAAFEYTHRQGRTLNSRRRSIVVYDLGGGTFDASRVTVDGADHEITASIGLNRLGGDDFDRLLAELVVASRGSNLGALAPAEQDRLLDDAREAKERIAPQSKHIVVELGGDPVQVAVRDFYDLASDLVELTMAAMEPLTEELRDGSRSDIAGIYLVGGATALPLVPRLLREHFGHRVHRSGNPTASTAVGLAIAADPDSGYRLSDQLSRGVGVFREVDAGRAPAFDEIFGPGQRMGVDADGHGSDTVTVRRRYRPAHNVGWFRFIEYRPDPDGLDSPGPGGSEGIAAHGPGGDLIPFGDLIMPFDPELEGLDDAALRAVPVERCWPDGAGPQVEETSTIDRHGIITVTIRNLETGHERRRELTGLAG